MLIAAELFLAGSEHPNSEEMPQLCALLSLKPTNPPQKRVETLSFQEQVGNEPTS